MTINLVNLNISYDVQTVPIYAKHIRLIDLQHYVIKEQIKTWNRL
jgi:hypothetical protein